MKTLEYAHDMGGIPLTKAHSNFHRKFVEWAAVEFDWPGYEPEELYAINKVLNEPDFSPLFEMHSLLMETRLMRHYRCKAVVTKAGRAMIGQHGELQALLMDAMMVSPFGGDGEAYALVWDVKHFLEVISNRLDTWVTVADFAEWIVPVDIFKAPQWSTPGNEAALFVALHVVRPLAWLGLIDDGARQRGHKVLFRDRLIRKTPLFDHFVKIIPGGIADSEELSGTVH